jgi:DUF971 family protein
MKGRTTVAAALAATLAALAGVQAAGASQTGPAASPATAACSLGNGAGAIRHVIYLQFDNTHYTRDNPSVASDLEQMPHLLQFLTQNGTLFTNDHTILISHTAGGILSSLTGLYPDRNGQTVSNSYDYFRNDGSPTFTSSFKYWTASVDGADDPLPNMIADTGKNTPAPWVPFTRAGCDVGGVGTANLEFENNGDVSDVYGASSAEAAETSAQKSTDFIGIAVHCAQTGTSVCAGNEHARPDLLPDEPGGYEGFQALFGAKYVDPAITGGDPCVEDTSGNPIGGSTGCGFPGFDGMTANNSLGYVAQMQEAGIPVTYAYISDAHDNHVLRRASGPGEADYKAQLAAYDAAFQAFFARLQADGIDRSNTLFVVTVDEGDHFAGGVGSPNGSDLTYTHAACPQASVDAVTPCPSDQIGEVNVRIGSVLPAGEPGFDIHFDDAPTFYVDGQPGRTDPAVRQLERDVWNARAPDPYAGDVVPIATALADPVEEKTLHMVNADPKRTPTFTMFGNPDFFFQTTPLGGGCAGSDVCVNPGFAWNHGDVQPEIANTWAGVVGPGVAANGVDSATWTDHANLRPTMLSLLGLSDDYRHDGRVLLEGLAPAAVPSALAADRATATRLGDVYEQLNAPFGSFAAATLRASTKALASTSNGVYSSLESRLEALTAHRDQVATQIESALEAAAFTGTPLPADAHALLVRAQALIDQAGQLAATS